MPFITVSNSKKLIKKIDQLYLSEIEEKIYDVNIDFFSEKEITFLKGIREFLRDPEKFSLEYYKPIEVKDSLNYIYPEKQPSFHDDENCSRLKSDFINYEIPYEIKARGITEVEKFRAWWHQNQHLLLEGENEKYVYKLQATFFIKEEINPNSIVINNSGTEKTKNKTLIEIKHELDKLLNEAQIYYQNNSEKQLLIKRFGKLTFLAYVKGNIFTNDSGLNDDDLKKFLKEYDEKFKKPIKNLLIDYYRLLYNPNMIFSQSILETLGFKKCLSCHITNSEVLPKQENSNESKFIKLQRDLKTVTCPGSNCPIKNECFRFLVLNSSKYENRASLTKIYYKDGKCRFFFKRYDWQLREE